MKEIIVGQLLAIVDAIDHEVEEIKLQRKDIRTKQNTVSKAIKLNEELQLPTADYQPTLDELVEKLEQTKNDIRDYKLVRYRMLSTVDIINGKAVPVEEEV